MKGRRVSFWYNEDGDYLEILFQRGKETYFNEVKKDYMEIVDKKTKKVVGYAIFNFRKRKQKFIDVEFPMPEEVSA